MRVIKIDPRKGLNGGLYLGRQGENAITQVDFDWASWAEEFGAGTLSIAYQRSADAAPYLVVTTVSGTVSTWVVGSADTQYSGEGMCEVSYSVNGKIAKSEIYRTVVTGSIGATTTPPAAWQPYVDAVAANATAAQTAAASVSGLTPDINANTAARHSHSNKSLLDTISDAWTTAVTWVTTNGANVLSHLADTVKHITASERTAWDAKVGEAPADGKKYARKDGAWAEVTGGGGGTSDFEDLYNRPKYNGTTMSHSTNIPEVKTATWDAKADAEDIPTKTSDLTNDSGFIDSSYHDNSKADVSTTYTKSEVDTAISAHHDASKQDVVSDLATIRSGAALGATALQSVPDTYRTSAAQDVIDATKVDKVDGKGLSTEDYTTAEKTKLSGIEAGADVTDATNVAAAGAVMVSAQGAKTSTQTEAVGVDADGKLWTAPSGGGGSEGAVRYDIAQSLTTAQQKQACSNAGAVYDGQYELIEEITLTENVSIIERTTDSRGVAYNLKSVVIVLNTTNTATENRSILCYVNDLSTNVVRSLNAYQANSAKYFCIRLDCINGRAFCSVTNASGEHYTSQPISTTYFGYGTNAINAITKLKFSVEGGNNTLLSGTKIKIYGVRA